MALVKKLLFLIIFSRLFTVSVNVVKNVLKDCATNPEKFEYFDMLTPNVLFKLRSFIY